MFFLPVLSLTLNSCDNGENGPMDDPTEGDLCKNAPTLSIKNITHTFTGQSTGSIEVSTSGGNGVLMYSIDGVNFASSKVFKDLGAGNYTITVVDENECEGTISSEIKEFPEVSFADDVFPIIQSNCLVSGCHLDNPGLPKWDNYTIIAANADAIRFRVTGKTMPPSSSGISLSDGEIATIRNWVDVGAPNN